MPLQSRAAQGFARDAVEIDLILKGIKTVEKFEQLYERAKSVFGNFSFYSYKKACGQKKTVRGSKNSRRLSNGTPAI